MTREEAIQALNEIFDDSEFSRYESWYGTAMDMAIEALSAEAEPIIIKINKLLRKEDFDKIAEDIKKQNENIICIPCDAEVVSAEAEDRHYIKIYADDEPSVQAEKLYQICGETQNKEVAKWLKEYFPSAEWTPVSEELPKQGQEVICQCRASIIKILKLDANGDWYQDADHCYMGGFVIAWMPLPKPYREDGE